MFDVGFSELLLLAVVGLVVLGPQRLPVAIRTVMGWVRTVRGLAANVQNELKQELKLQELQESIKKAEQLNLNQLSPELGKTVEELKVEAEKLKTTLQQQAAASGVSVEEHIQSVKSAVKFQQESATDTALTADPSGESPSAPEAIADGTDNTTVETTTVETNMATAETAETAENPTALSATAPLPEAAPQTDAETLRAKLADYYPPDEETLTPAAKNTPS